VCVRRTHGRYAQYNNARKQRSGHLLESRFFSCPLDEEHLWTALGYVELNPVRAGVVRKAEEYPDSSGRAHFGMCPAMKGLDMESWRVSGAAGNWAVSLERVQNEEDQRKLRRATYAGSPLGDDGFVKRWLRVSEREEGEKLQVAF
jgi:putative transposase